MPDWNAQLRAARESLGISRQSLADLSGQSFESLRSYELGRRRPTREHLLSLLKSMKLDQPSRNLILTSAGFATEGPVERFPEPNVPTNEASELVRGRPLPTFLLNQRAEVLALSNSAWRLVELPDLESNPTARRSVLTVATRRALASRAENWDEIVTGMIQVFKVGVPEEPDLDAPGLYLKAILKQLTAGDAALATRFVELWQTAPAFEGRLTGLMYPCVWKAPVGTIRFNCLISCLNTAVGLYAHTWIPADAKSHLRLEQLLADHRRRSNSAVPRPHRRIAAAAPTAARRRSKR
jgi:transcriptional regulator with XRE-family HTH domain